MALTPDKAAEITMQPIKEFDMDAAIIFSDILVIPYAMGQELDYVPGPKLGKFDKKFFEADMETFIEKCKPVYEAITKVRNTLCHSKSLIGFAGAPWTLYRYMSGNVMPGHIDEFDGAWMMQRLTDYIVEHLSQQIKAGCDTVQLFDSWASAVPASQRRRLIFEPTRLIVEGVRKRGHKQPIIGFPKGIGEGLIKFVNVTGVDAVGLDQSVDPVWAHENLPENFPVQGNLDPMSILHAGSEMYRDIDHILDAFKSRPHIFNLGHGITPPTPPENVQLMLNHVKRHLS